MIAPALNICAMVIVATTLIACARVSAQNNNQKILQFPTDQAYGHLYSVSGLNQPDQPVTASVRSWAARGTVKFEGKSAIGMEALYPLSEHPEVLRSLPADALQQLNFNKLSIGDQGLKNVSHITSLVRLDLNECDITDNGIQYLTGLKNLNSLNLGHTLVTGKTLGLLASLPHLQKIDLNHCDLSKSDLSALVQCKEMKFLHLNNCELTDASMTSIAKMTSLETLSVPDNLALSGEGIKKLSTLKKLTRLDVTSTKVDAKDLATLKGCHLISLEIYKTQGTASSIARLRTLFPGCHISIKSVPRLPLDLFKPLH